VSPAVPPPLRRDLSHEEFSGMLEQIMQRNPLGKKSDDASDDPSS